MNQEDQKLKSQSHTTQQEKAAKMQEMLKDF